MKDIKIGIIGIGNIGFSHLQCICAGQVQGLTVAAVCDIDSQKLSAAQSAYPHISVYTDYRKLLEQADIDGVLISVPHPLHAEIATCTLLAGKHTLVEKPVDISVSRAKALNKVAQSSGKVFGIMFNQRTNSLFAKARQILCSGELGVLTRTVWIVTNWYRTQCYYDSCAWRATWAGEGGGVLLNQAPHNLDLWQWICGMPDSVTSFCPTGKFHNIEVEDEATIYTTYPGGGTGVFITSTGDFPGTNRLEITGTKGKLLLENGVLKHWRLQQDTRDVCQSSLEYCSSIPMEYTEYTASAESAHQGILQNFTDAIREGKPLLAPGVEGVQELTISNAAYLSQWLGNTQVPIPFDEALFDRLLLERKQSSLTKTAAGKAVAQDHACRWQVKW